MTKSVNPKAELAIRGVDKTGAAKPHVLFVDDETALLEMLALYFRHMGLEVTSTPTAGQAMDLIAEKRFDAIVLDLNLGGGDGLDVLRFAKAKFSKIPVIIFTGLQADENLVKRCFADRADGFMRKTDGLQSLLTEVKRHLPQA